MNTAPETPPPETGGTPSPSQWLRAWATRMGLKPTKAARALGLTYSGYNDLLTRRNPSKTIILLAEALEKLRGQP